MQRSMFDKEIPHHLNCASSIFRFMEQMIYICALLFVRKREASNNCWVLYRMYHTMIHDSLFGKRILIYWEILGKIGKFLIAARWIG